MLVNVIEPDIFNQNGHKGSGKKHAESKFKCETELVLGSGCMLFKMAN
jgi:hypothetical protein